MRRARPARQGSALAVCERSTRHSAPTLSGGSLTPNQHPWIAGFSFSFFLMAWAMIHCLERKIKIVFKTGVSQILGATPFRRTFQTTEAHTPKRDSQADGPLQVRCT
jgi:hypothetical protein